MVQAWKCDKAGCGHVWYTDGVTVPKRCARCKSPAWNRGMVVQAGQSFSDPQIANEHPEVKLKPRSAGLSTMVVEAVAARVVVEHPPFIAGEKCECCSGPVYEARSPVSGLVKWTCQRGHWMTQKQPKASK